MLVRRLVGRCMISCGELEQKRRGVEWIETMDRGTLAKASDSFAMESRMSGDKGSCGWRCTVIQCFNSFQMTTFPFPQLVSTPHSPLSLLLLKSSTNHSTTQTSNLTPSPSGGATSPTKTRRFNHSHRLPALTSNVGTHRAYLYVGWPFRSPSWTRLVKSSSRMPVLWRMMSVSPSPSSIVAAIFKM